MTVEYYVEYLYPGSLFPEESSVRLSSHWNMKEALAKLDRRCFAFSFYDLRIREGTLEGKKIRDTERFNASGRYYPDAAIYTVDQVKALGPDYRTLTANMEGNGWPLVVKSRLGNWQPFTEMQDHLILISTAAPATPAASSEQDGAKQ